MNVSSLSFRYRVNQDDNEKGTGANHKHFDEELNNLLEKIEKEGKYVVHMQQTQSTVGEWVHVFVSIVNTVKKLPSLPAGYKGPKQ